MLFAPIQVTSNVISFYHLLSPAQGCVAYSFQSQSLYCIWGCVFCCFCFFVENKYFWGHLGGSIGVWAQLIFYGFLWSLCHLDLGNVEEKAKPQLAEFGMAFLYHCFPSSQANQSSSSYLQLLPRVAEQTRLSRHGIIVPTPVLRGLLKDV